MLKQINKCHWGPIHGGGDAPIVGAQPNPELRNGPKKDLDNPKATVNQGTVKY